MDNVTELHPPLTRTEVAMRRMASRAKRLARLIELKAPEVIIAREAAMVYEASLLLNRAGVHASADHVAEHARILAGFCIEPECDKAMQPDSIFHHCPKHHAEAEIYCAQMDKNDEGDDAN
jgi:hypothetical protein